MAIDMKQLSMDCSHSPLVSCWLMPSRYLYFWRDNFVFSADFNCQNVGFIWQNVWMNEILCVGLTGYRLGQQLSLAFSWRNVHSVPRQTVDLYHFSHWRTIYFRLGMLVMKALFMRIWICNHYIYTWYIHTYQYINIWHC